MRIKLLILLACFSMMTFVSCDKNNSVSEELLTEEQKKAEKDNIIKVLSTYNEGARERNWSKMVTTLADEVTFFGTDSGEVSKNFSEFKNTMQKQWDEYDVLEYGDIQDAYIELDDYARYANVIFGSPIIFGVKGQKPDTVFAIYQRTLNKDPIQKRWVIKSGILAISRKKEVAQ